MWGSLGLVLVRVAQLFGLQDVPICFAALFLNRQLLRVFLITAHGPHIKVNLVKGLKKEDTEW